MQRPSFPFQKTTNRRLSTRALPGQSQSTCQGRASLSSQVRPPSTKTGAALQGLNLQLGYRNRSSHTDMFSAALPREVTRKAYMPPPHRTKELATKGRTEIPNWHVSRFDIPDCHVSRFDVPDCHMSSFDIHLQNHLWMYCPGHVRVEGFLHCPNFDLPELELSIETRP